MEAPGLVQAVLARCAVLGRVNIADCEFLARVDCVQGVDVLGEGVRVEVVVRVGAAVVV